MVDKINKLFSSECGALVYKNAKRAIADFSMEEELRRGVLVGLSGGADSVMLLLFLYKYARDCFSFPIVAVHVNHRIRGKEADRDEAFSKKLCERLGVDFISRKVDVPRLAEASGASVEEAARNARYSVFRNIIRDRNDVSAIAVAHNADDNFETVIINMIRGAGCRGMSGISARRDGIIRPLIYSQKSTILSALASQNIDFVTDSTNESDDYTRNYIRHNVLQALTSSFENLYPAIEKMCRNLREDDECLMLIARKFASKHENGKIPTAELSKLHGALLFRVLKIYFEGVGSFTLERTHVSSIAECLARGGGDFSVSVPGRMKFSSICGLCGFCEDVSSQSAQEFFIELSRESTEIPEFSAEVVISREEQTDYFSKVYNISTQANLTSAIIKGDLFIRNKRDGDSYFFGGMTHKVKKLFNDRKIPAAKRPLIPVLCDESGIVWVPGFGVRDDGGRESLFVRISVDAASESGFCLPQNPFVTKTNKKGKKVT